MKRRTLAVVDYGAGNLASVTRALTGLGHRCRSTRDPAALAAADAVVLPGVGAFPAAMQALRQHGLADALRERAAQGQPLIGICLGMQLLADESLEQTPTAGLGLIPGRVRPLGRPAWHIGWNAIEVADDEPLLAASQGGALYFNHSFVFDTPQPYRRALAWADAVTPLTAAVRRANVVGLQFHPEKSQAEGRRLLSHVIEGLCHAA